MENSMWPQVLTIIGANLVLLIGMLGTTIMLFLHANRRIDEALKGISEEMKDFHTKLALQDQEFKMRLCAIEEKRNKLLKD